MDHFGSGLDSGPVRTTDRASTPVERLIIVWGLILLSVGLGLVWLYLGFTASPDKAEAAAKIRLDGFASLGFAALVWVVNRVLTWVLDR